MNDFDIQKSTDCVVITLLKQDFETLGKALKAIGDEYFGRKVLMMQSLKRDDGVFKVVVVFEF